MSIIVATASDIVRRAAKAAGILATGQIMPAEDFNDILMLLNGMIASWQQSRWLIFHLIDVKCLSTGQQTYSVGPGGDFNVTRPDRIQAAYVRLLNNLQGAPTSGSGPVDYPLSAVETFEEYSRITLKQLISFPNSYFYDPTLVLGTLYPWPIPNDTFELHLILKDTLSSFTNLQSQFNLPPEYYEGLYFNLIMRICLAYNVALRPEMQRAASVSLNIIRNANNRVPLLRMPAGLAGTGDGGWEFHGVGGVVEGTFTLNQTGLG